MNVNPPTVSQVVGSIKKYLEGQFRTVEVIGEVSNLSRSGAGHVYFTLSDSSASLNCCLFKMDALRNPIAKSLKNGDKLTAFGSVGVYAQRGSFQLIAKRIAKAGVGDLKVELEKLKRRLAADGLFDMATKKPIPEFPKKIGLITAEGSAAFYDFVNVTKRRTAWMNIVFSPATVQGKAAPLSLRKALEKLIKFHIESKDEEKLDAIVLTRGGGSLEDLWAFNDEGLAWDIFNCPVPVISAVGHDVDFSISDYVSDKRCETPTAAAEILSAGQDNLITRLERVRTGLKSSMHSCVVVNKHRLEANGPKNIIRILEAKFYSLQKRLSDCRIEHRLLEFVGYNEKIMRLEECLGGLKSFPRRVTELSQTIENNIKMLSLLDPRNVLNRGYSFVRSSNGKVVSDMKTFDGLSEKSMISIHFKDGVGNVVKAGEN
jgi:exodeoxyribonuclease VII large subunit